MPERLPEKWTDPAIYKERRRRSFRLYFNVHWTIPENEPRQPNTRQMPKRRLKPEIQEWLDTMGFPYRLNLKGGGQSKIIFEQDNHAALFKLTWI
jgi:hypothetical protein